MTISAEEKCLPCDLRLLRRYDGLDHWEIWTTCHFATESELNRQVSFHLSLSGSLVDGTPARLRARQMMSLMWEWRAEQPALRRHAKLWVPRASTRAPQVQQRFVPNRRPTATLTASSSNRRPQLEIGRAWSQSPEWGAIAASSLARSWLSTAEGNSLLLLCPCRQRIYPIRLALLWDARDNALRMGNLGLPRTECYWIRKVRSSVSATEIQCGEVCWRDRDLHCRSQIAMGPLSPTEVN